MHLISSVPNPEWALAAMWAWAMGGSEIRPAVFLLHPLGPFLFYGQVHPLVHQFAEAFVVGHLAPHPATRWGRTNRLLLLPRQV